MRQGRFLSFLVFSVVFSMVIAFQAESNAQQVRIATAAKTYPYIYSCQSASGVCGVEYEWIRGACQVAGLDCVWMIRPWSVGPQGPLGAGGLLNGLIPRAGAPLEYDLVVNSVSMSADRRMEVLFTMAYYDAYHIVIGKPGFSVADPIFGPTGFPVDRPHFLDPARKLRILTYPGAMQRELIMAYGSAPQHVEIVTVGTDLQTALVSGQGDVLYAWTGIERQIQDLVAGGQDYRVLSTTRFLREDPFNAVGAAAPATREGRQLTERLNAAMIQLRRDGFHRRIFTQIFGLDLWPCQQAPYIDGDPKCVPQPK